MANNAAMERLSGKHILEWDEDDVHTFLSSLGFSELQDNIVDDRITGDILVLFDNDTLKDYGLSIGQRLTVLKAIYQLKLAYGIEIGEEDWVPPSEALISPGLDGDSRREHSETETRDSFASQGSSPDLERLGQIVHHQSDRITRLESENARLSQLLISLMEDFAAFRAEHHANSDNTLPSISQLPPGSNHSLDRKPSFKWGSLSNSSGKVQVSPTKSSILEIGSPAASPTFPPNHPTNGQSATPPRKLSNANEPNRSTPPLAPGQQPTQSQTQQGPRPTLSSSNRGDSSDNFKSFKVSLEDPTWKVLPAALKKYKINNDNWQNYAMFICYGSSGNRIERCLAYDEKPLLLFQKLKDAKKTPVFMLKHIKDIRSPIVVAQQKHAARKANSVASSEGTVGGAPPSTPASGLKPKAHRPPKLEVHDLSSAPPGPESSILSAAPVHSLAPSTALLTGNGLLATATGSYNGTGWPTNHELSSPATEHPSTSLNVSSVTGSHLTAPGGAASSTSTQHTTRELPPPSSNSQVSYAVAIYPYMAEQEDEFDVVVGDTFIILSRARGWWVVQRDLDGTGKVLEGTGADGEVLQGWVPAGCLLETNVPVASAIAEAEAAKSATFPSSSAISRSNSSNSIPDEPDTPRDADGPDEGTEGTSSGSGTPGASSKSKTPILPLSIISTSFPGIALMEYRRKGEEELDLEKDDRLRVFKRYNHWSYAVKEDGGDRGWVPSWFIGKVSSNPNAPNPATTSNTTPGDESQMSPMSSAFPLGGSTPVVAGGGGIGKI